MKIIKDQNGNEYTIKDFQVRNLRKLAAYLNSLPRDYREFRMYAFMVTDKNRFSGGRSIAYASKISQNMRSCGTVACACGHGPDAGIPAKRLESWSHYQSRAFGIEDLDLSGWCFGGSWGGVDDTPRGAAQRITLMLNKGAIPKDWKDQLVGDAPLSYTKVRVPKIETVRAAA